jgi:hypothetical protein
MISSRLREAELGQDLAHFLGDEGHQVDDLLGRADELGAQPLVLRADADRAGVRMALADHDAAHRDQRERADAEFLGAEDRGDDDVAPGLEPAIGAQLHAAAQAVESQRLVDFGQAHFPRRAGIFDRSLRARAGAADMAGDEDHVGMRLGDARRDRADARRADQLDADPRARIDHLQVVDELREVLDRIDVVVRRRARSASRRASRGAAWR